MKKIIAIVGMCGVGKSVACSYLESIGFKKVYFGGVTLSKLKEEGLEDTPENEKMMREKLRRELGMGAYAVVLEPEITKLAESHDVVLDGLYSWDELTILKKKLDITTIAITADKETRYDRLGVREVRPFTKSEAIKRDIAEIENLAKGGPIAYADYYADNNGTIKDLEARLQDIVDNL